MFFQIGRRRNGTTDVRQLNALFNLSNISPQVHWNRCFLDEALRRWMR
ncbi:hypothetical protein [Novipirellula artificiosorum]|uniref:Uncharacterized protein n=1 Tax=Novipirellula artificiosorum TaxID=2528016 RepID=A0A5C6DT76_9BACT|nr:hypothetical protein [Novipirellula artificiosorum]TWU39505.1 hypothetical protein Poly41_23600 [Novipirellula artificiosorum]